LAPKGIQEKLSGRTAEPNHRLTSPNAHTLASSGPLDLEPETLQPTTQKTAAAPNVSPQRGIHRGRETARPQAIGSAKILVVDEELVEIRHGTYPSEAEEPDRRAGPDLLDE
jgi:hypothetical protein